MDRIDAVDVRFEILRRQHELDRLRQGLASDRAFLDQLEQDRLFLHKCNIGGEAMTAEDQDRVRQMATRYQYVDSTGGTHLLLSEDEIYNLTIAKGTLTPEERKVINDHARLTFEMLNGLNYPKKLRQIPEIAGSHHERMDGKGYPRGLTGDQMSLQARILAIADVFEALTAHNRPYKPAMPLSQTLRILQNMAKEGHIDPDLLDIFIRHGVYARFAKEYLPATQIDVSLPTEKV
jgi:hypothetical protein